MEKSFSSSSLGSISFMSSKSSEYVPAQNMTFEDVSSLFPDSIYPIYDEMARRFSPSSIMCIISGFFLIVQIVFVASFFVINDGLFYIVEHDSFFKYLIFIYDFGINNSSVLSQSFCVIAQVLYVFFIGISYFFLRFRFHGSTGLIEYQLTLFRFLCSYLSHMAIIPSCISVSMWMKSPSLRPIEYPFLVFSLISTASIIFVVYRDSFMRSNTIYLENTLFLQWRPTNYLCLVYSSAIIAFMTNLFSEYVSFIKILSYGYSLFLVYLFIRGFIFDFAHIYINLIFSAFCGALAFLSIESCHFKQTNRVYLMFFVVFILVLIILIVYLSVIRKGKDIFCDISSINTAKKSISLTFSFKPQMLAEFVLLNKIMEKYNSTKMILHAAKFISLFPEAFYKLKPIIELLSERSDFTYHDRFLFYQICRVFFLRQVSGNKGTNSEIINIQKASYQIISNIKTILYKMMENEHISIDSFIFLHSQLHISNKICIDALYKYPKDENIVNEYAKYLIECRSKFLKGLSLMKTQRLMKKKDFKHTDFCSNFFTKAFPIYYGILDFNGVVKDLENRIPNRTKSSGKRKSSDNNSYSSDEYPDDSRVIEDDFSDEIMSSITEQPKQRLAFEKVLKHVQNRYILAFRYSYIFIIVFFVVGVVVFYNILENRITNRVHIFNVLYSFSRFSINLDESVLSFLQTWINGTGFSEYFSLTNPQLYFNNVEFFDHIHIDPKSLFYKSIGESLKSFYNFSLLASQMDMDDRGYVMLFLPNFFDVRCINNNTMFQFVYNCTGSHRIMAFLKRLVQISGFNYLNESWHNNSNFCETVLNVYTLEQIIESEKLYFINRENYFSSNFLSFLQFSKVIITPLVFVLLFLPTFIPYKLFVDDFQNHISIVSSVSRESLQKATQNILKSSSFASFSSNGAMITNKRLFIPIFAFLCSSISSFLIYIYITVLEDRGQKLKDYCIWYTISCNRQSSIVQSLYSSFFWAMSYSIGPTHWPSLVKSRYLALHEINQNILRMHSLLKQGSNNSAPINGFSPLIDDINFHSSCSKFSFEDHINNTYKCLNLDQMVSVYLRKATDAENFLLDQNSTTNSKLFQELWDMKQLGLLYMIPKIQNTSLILENEWRQVYFNFFRNFTLMAQVAGVIILIYFVASNYSESIMDGAYKSLKLIIGRMSPQEAISNPRLYSLITNRFGFYHKGKPLYSTILHYSDHCVLIFDTDFTIKYVNSKCLETFEKTENQMVNQDLGKFISLEQFICITEETKMISKSKFHLPSQITLGICDSEFNCSLLWLNNSEFALVIDKSHHHTVLYENSAHQKRLINQQIMNTYIPIEFHDIKNFPVAFFVDQIVIVVMEIGNFGEFAQNLHSYGVFGQLQSIYNSLNDIINRYYKSIAFTFRQHANVQYIAFGRFSNSSAIYVDKAIDFLRKFQRNLNQINYACGAHFQLRTGIHYSTNVLCGFYQSPFKRLEIFGEALIIAEKLHHIAIPGQTILSEDAAKEQKTEYTEVFNEEMNKNIYIMDFEPE